MNRELIDANGKLMKLAAQLMETATELKINVDILSNKNQELEKTKETLLALHRNNSRLMRSRLLSQWGLRVRYAHAMERMFRHLSVNGRDNYYTMDGEGPFAPDYKSNKELLRAASWREIWSNVEKRVKHRYQVLCDSVKLSDAPQEET